MSDLPFVTCLCLTKGRKEWLPGVVDAFLKQDYPQVAELVFVIDEWADILEASPAFKVRNDNRRFAAVRSASGKPVGTKRNAGCEWAINTPIIAIWDDDDYSAPGRLTQQVETLLSTGKAVTGYTGLKFTDGKEWWRFKYFPVDSRYKGGDWDSTKFEYVHATSLCFRRDWWQTHPFEELQVGQDERFALAASSADQLAPCPDLDLMYATIHPGNTSPRVRVNGALVGSNWEPLPGYQSPHPNIFPR